MKDEELDIIIERLNGSTYSELPYFEVTDYNKDADEACIKANKPGLENVALTLFKASKAATTLKNTEEPVYVLDRDFEWFDGELYIGHIEFVDAPDPRAIRQTTKEKVSDKLSEIGCAAVLITLGVIFLIGLGTVLGWIF